MCIRDRLKTLVSEIGPSQSMYSAINVLDEAHVKQSMDKVTEKWGAINCVVNCAGKLQTKYLDSDYLFASKSSQLDNILVYYYDMLFFILFLFF